MYRRKPRGWLGHIDFVLLDIISLVLAFVLAWYVRFGQSQWTTHYDVFVVYLLIAVLLHIVNDTFASVIKRGRYKEFTSTLVHVATVELATVMYLFITQQGNDISRLVIGLVAVFYLLISYLTRMIWKKVLRKWGSLTEPASLYVITTSELAEKTLKSLNSSVISEYKILGVCLLDKNEIGKVITNVPVTSDADTVLNYLRDKWVDEVYMALPEQHPTPNHIVDVLTEMGIAVHIELDPAGSESWQIRQVQYVAGKLVQTVSMTNVSTRDVLTKRIMDIIGGIVGCLITVVLTVILGPLIYLQSPGPIFFSQTRVGKNGKTFKMYKFRSMYPDAEARKAELMKDNRFADSLMFKMEADPRIIGCKILPDGTVKKGLGNFIRDYSLDEFPQFFNVLKGDLSLVGTRPPTVDEWERYNYHHRVRMSVRPGITGMWQVSGRSNITDFDEVVELDKKYILQWSPGLDLRILLKTIWVIFKKDGAM